VGSFVTGRFGYGQSKRNFEAFFKRLGRGYAEFQSVHDVYDVFRCGMAHEYTVKQSSKIAMRRSAEDCGVGIDPADGRYYFVVERYCDDFFAAAESLFDELMAKPSPKMPTHVGRPVRTKTSR
jgi:hypothetical protein